MPYKTSRNIDRLKELIKKEDFLFLWSDDNDGKIFRGRDGSGCFWIQDKDNDYLYATLDECIGKFIELDMGFIDPED